MLGASSRISAIRRFAGFIMVQSPKAVVWRWPRNDLQPRDWQRVRPLLPQYLWWSAVAQSVAAAEACGHQRPGSQLLHQGEQVPDTPVFGNLALVHTHSVNRLKVDLPAGSRHT